MDHNTGWGSKGHVPWGLNERSMEGGTDDKLKKRVDELERKIQKLTGESVPMCCGKFMKSTGESNLVMPPRYRYECGICHSSVWS